MVDDGVIIREYPIPTSLRSVAVLLSKARENPTLYTRDYILNVIGLIVAIHAPSLIDEYKIR